MAHNGGTPRLLAKCGSAVEVLDEQQIEDPALARVKRARTTGHTDSLPAVARTQLGKWPPASRSGAATHGSQRRCDDDRKTPSGSRQISVVDLAVIAGLAGGGKAGLAVRWVRRPRAVLPTGSCVSLRGYDA